MPRLTDRSEDREVPFKINFTYHSYSKVPGGRETLKGYEPDLEESIEGVFLEQENSKCILEWFKLNSYRLNINIEYIESEDRYNLRGYLKPSDEKLLDIYFREREGELDILEKRIKRKALPSYLRGPIPDETFQEVDLSTEK